MPARDDILNLIHRFALYFDQGQFDEALSLFAQGRFRVGEEEWVSPAHMHQIWQNILILYDGTPRTKHVITNAIVDVSEDGKTARCQSYYTVFQSTGAAQINPIICGRYDDRFVRAETGWYFAERDYRFMEITGDLSRHLTPEAIAKYS